MKEETARLARLEAELGRVAQERAALRAGLDGGEDRATLEAALERIETAAAGLEAEVGGAELRHSAARAAELSARAPLAEAERKAQNLATQVQTLSKLLNAGSGGFWPRRHGGHQRRQRL